MKRIFTPLALLTVAACAADDWTLPEEKPAFQTGAGAELVQSNCLVCHSSEYITTQPAMTRDQWKASIVKMQQKYGAPVAAEQVEPLLDYLVDRYGRRGTP
jgi:sulfite dehydrogenase (cytochrome) subunit B